MAQGRRSAWVIDRACKKFRVSPPTIERDIAYIRARWARESSTDRERMRDEFAVQIDHAIAKAYARGDGRSLPALLRLKGQFHGLIAEKETNGQVTAEQVAALVAELSTRPKTASGPQDRTSLHAPAAESSVSHRAGEEKTEA